ncbi:recombinase family protein [Cognatiyoonia sp. IB215446]|uniref:recombinase family protein n=1 Tax=Cognatiyoonia sp. IB215446 TaxID=3097355 RepID=UPI002A0C7B91|nr:recombinase family protein [Cognatiyoonia sp. IB215446]MDX8347374.1 recombinase family protein [Cognatiyoonia sp. IB215446]
MSIWPIIHATGRRIGYARVSTKDQKLRMQRDALSDVACDRIFEDHGISGSAASRSGLDAMLAELQEGDTVIVFKLDRLGRSVLHLSDLLVRFRNDSIHFCSLSEGINTTTPGGKLIYHVFSAFAEFQRDLIVENTLAGLQATKRRGTKLGRPPALDIETATLAHQSIRQKGISISEAARRIGADRSTLTRWLSTIDAE